MMKYHVVWDEADSSKLAVIGADGFTPSGSLGLSPERDGEQIRDPEILTANRVYYPPKSTEYIELGESGMPPVYYFDIDDDIWRSPAPGEVPFYWQDESGIWFDTSEVPPESGFEAYQGPTHIPEVKYVITIDADKEQQVLADRAVSRLAGAKEEAYRRLTKQADSYLETATTPSGYPCNKMAREKAQASLLIMQLPDGHPMKGLEFYDSDRVGEIFAVGSALDAADTQARAAIAASNDPDEIDSINLQDYMG